MTSNMETALTIAMVLSLVVLLLVVVAIINVWRRETFPEISYGGITLTQRRLRWLWFVVIVASLGLVAAEDPVVYTAVDRDDPELREDAASVRTVKMAVPLPFYRYDRERVYADGELARELVGRSILIPRALLTTLLAYLLLVVRWNPENRWALRILHGKTGTGGTWMQSMSSLRRRTPSTATRATPGTARRWTRRVSSSASKRRARRSRTWPSRSARCWRTVTVWP